MGTEMRLTRRQALVAGLVGGAALALPHIAAGAAPQAEEEGFGVSAIEDLMREHGALQRLLLIYEAVWSWPRAEGARLTELRAATDLVRRFIEDYHERLEEEYVFPLVERSQEGRELVAVLRRQHDAGREATDRARRRLGELSDVLRPNEDLAPLWGDLRAYVRMYRPHMAREDTVLFLQFRSLLTPAEMQTMGDRFEEREHALFGEEGFETIVTKIGEIEKELGIYSLEQFTPSAAPFSPPV